MTTTQGEHAQTALAHELFAAAQLAPGEGIEDAVRRIAAALTAAQEVPKCEFLAHGCDTPSYCQSVQRCTARDEKRAAPAQPAAPQGVAYAVLPDGGTPGPWFVRKLEKDGELRGCFVAAPDYLGMPYDAEILGDDEYRDKPESDETSGMRRRLADCELIVAAVNQYRASHGQAPAWAAPEGWKLVPVKPTFAMIQAGLDKKNASVYVSRRVPRIYESMLNAAPSAPTAQAAPAAGSVAGPSVRKVFLVATGEEHEGEATYTRYDDDPPPLCDSECLYTAAPTPAAQADSVLEDAARLLRQILAASQDGDSDTHLSAHFVSRIETITKPGGAA